MYSDMVMECPGLHSHPSFRKTTSTLYARTMAKTFQFNHQHFENTVSGSSCRRDSGITGLSIHETGEPGKGRRFEIMVPPGYFHF
jgi:hypothetical protein